MSEYNNENIFSKRLRAGKRRTYFFDVRTTKNNDYFVTLTESKKRYDGEGYDRHKIFLYKEDFNKFAAALNDTINHVKTELMPDFDFDAFSHDDYEEQKNTEAPEDTHTAAPASATAPIPAETAEPIAPVAEELNSTPTQDVAYNQEGEIENPSANDEAETW